MSNRRANRRRLRRKVYFVPFLVVLVIYQYSQIPSLPPSDGSELPAGSTQLPQIFLKDDRGTLISRKSSSLSHYLPIADRKSTLESSASTTTSTTSLADARRGREDILSILKDAGIANVKEPEVLLLPTSEQVKNLYGRGPVIIGLETCQAFREHTPASKRFIGVSGMFNSGTTAFGLSLQANCHFDNHPRNFTNEVLTDSNGMLTQVPWAKHKNARERQNHTIHNEIHKDDVLPIVLVRDPYYWMQSMCKQGYGARWDHIPNKHCPNLVPNDFDKRRFKRLRQAESVLVWMGASRTEGPHWDSLVHLWNDWYNSYLLEAKFPRLMIRFEDTLFHGKEVMEQVCTCAGGHLSSSKFQYLVDEAKWNHKQAKQNNMVSAIIKYGTDLLRYSNMTNDDLAYARQMLDLKLMDTFQYKIF